MKLNTLVLAVIFIFQNIIAGNNIKKRVEELEKEKKELYNQIHVAIEDSVQTLRKTNNSESITGLKYMEELKRHITEIDKPDNYSDIGTDVESKSDLENRRKFSFHDKNTKHIQDPFNFENILKPKKKSESKWKEILENRIKMQKRLDEWILERQREKERYKEHRLQKKRLKMSGKYEKCPRFGYSSSKKKHSRKDKDKKGTAEEEDGSKKKKSGKANYPCCRKCCKKSYMGCL